jgi:DNA primase
MVDTSFVDARAFYSKYVTVAERPSNSRNDGKEYHGSCPWCGGHDRFAFWDSGRYSCSIRSSGCGRYGRDVLQFLMDYEGLSFFEACDRLGVDPGSEYLRPVGRRILASDDPPCQKWQERAAAVLHLAQKTLWSKRGTSALNYLKSRGFTNETIRRAQLGYIPLNVDGKWYKEPLESWELSSEECEQDRYDQKEWVWLPEAILIPWYADGYLWKLNIRRLSGLRGDDAKYVQIKGSREGLYNADALRVDEPLVLCESGFDALSGEQVCYDMAAFVATGATTRARRDRWLARMGLASRVLVAYDDDAPDRNGKRAGDEGAAYWVKALSHAFPWLPWAHDVNEMLQQGIAIRQWLGLGMNIASAAMLPNASSKNPLQVDAAAEARLTGDNFSSTCSISSAKAEFYSANGRAYRGGVDWQERPGALSSGYEQFMSVVNRIAAIFPGGCNITVLPTGEPFPASKQQRVYTPGILPALPRTQCPFEIVFVGSDQHIKAMKCSGKTLANGWCKAHQHAQQVLELGARLGYPRIALTAHRTIGEGKSHWEAYAIRASEKWLKHDILRMRMLAKRL